MAAMVTFRRSTSRVSTAHQYLIDELNVMWSTHHGNDLWSQVPWLTLIGVQPLSLSPGDFERCLLGISDTCYMLRAINLIVRCRQSMKTNATCSMPATYSTRLDVYDRNPFTSLSNQS